MSNKLFDNLAYDCIISVFCYSLIINMKKIITKIAIAASLIIILDSFSFWPIFMEFFFAGIVPGTNYRLDPGLMLAFSPIMAALIIFKAFVFPYIRKNYTLKNRQSKLKTTSKLA